MARILIIDDEPPVRAAIKRALDKTGYLVEEAANGLEGLQLAEAHRPDVVICDIVMPDREGIETIITLRRRYPDLKIVAISGYGNVGGANYLLMAAELGATATLAKPFRVEELRAIVGKMILTGPSHDPAIGSGDLSFQNLLDAVSGVAYVCDTSNVIRAFGRPNWISFAAKNGGLHLLDDGAVIGRSLFDFIDGDEVRDSYRRHLDRLASGARSEISFPYRCDSPGTRRELRMSMTRIGGAQFDGILFQSLVTSETVRPPIDLFDFPSLVKLLRERAKLPILCICSYCQRVRFPPGSDDATGEWLEAEEYYRRGGTSRVAISHGICPNCGTRIESVS